jgi:hypothetical protein
MKPFLGETKSAGNKSGLCCCSCLVQPKRKREDLMKAAFLALSLLGQPTVLISDRVPILNVEALCKDVSADDKASGLAQAQDAGECMRDETSAQQQLSSTWLTVPEPARESCEGQAMAGGIQSYVDLLTCLQMAGWDNSASPPAAPLRGASKNRNAKN